MVGNVAIDSGLVEMGPGDVASGRSIGIQIVGGAKPCPGCSGKLGWFGALESVNTSAQLLIIVHYPHPYDLDHVETGHAAAREMGWSDLTYSVMLCRNGRLTSLGGQVAHKSAC